MKSLFFLLFISFSSIAQEGSVPSWNSLTDNTLQFDTDQKRQTTDSVKPHSVLTATLLSAGIPGAGQIYNHIAMPKGKKKAFWKVPLIYAGLTTTTYFLVTNNRTKNELKTEYQTRLDNCADPNSDWAQYDDGAVLELYDQYLTWRDLSIMGLGLVYFIQVVDAGVEAHFVSFDVSEDLSLGLDPVMLDRRTAGLMFTLNFR